MTLVFALWIASSSLLLAQEPLAVARPALFEQMACAPSGHPVPPLAGLMILGGYVPGRIMFGPGDAVIINAGTIQGLQRGQQFFVRRPIRDASKKQPKVGALYGVHTAGWLTVVDVKDTMAVGQVSHACDGILEGDFLEPYVAPVLPTPALTGTADYQHPGQIMMADERRQTGYAGLMMLMNLGAENDVRPGHLLTIYRETLGGQGPIIDVGRATVLSVTGQSSLVRIDSSRQAVYVGDLVAIHRITP